MEIGIGPSYDSLESDEEDVENDEDLEISDDDEDSEPDLEDEIECEDEVSVEPDKDDSTEGPTNEPTKTLDVATAEATKPQDVADKSI